MVDEGRLNEEVEEGKKKNKNVGEVIMILSCLINPEEEIDEGAVEDFGFPFRAMMRLAVTNAMLTGDGEQNREDD